jgi:hypothetical protein
VPWEARVLLDLRSFVVGTSLVILARAAIANADIDPYFSRRFGADINGAVEYSPTVCRSRPCSNKFLRECVKSTSIVAPKQPLAEALDGSE